MAESRLEASPQITKTLDVPSPYLSGRDSPAKLDVIAAPATPPGESAVGMIRLSGDGCVRIAGSFIRWPKHELPPRTAVLAKAYLQNRLLDQVVLTYFPARSSYTGEDLLEICAHGSPYILTKILELAVAAGARLASPGEFTQRAYIHGRMDLAQAEAVSDLIRARTDLAHKTALSQLEGVLSSEIETLRQRILDTLAAVEADLDHPDEDLPTLGRTELRSTMQDIHQRINSLIQTHRIGRLLTGGARIAIVGRPNVGKSSLLNALLGRDRAIVSDVPGTTRDTLEEWADLEGLQALFIDTAGLRQEAADSIEQAGMERTRKALANCDLALVVVDRSRVTGPEDLAIIREVATICGPEQRPVIIVANKSDLPAHTATLPHYPFLLEGDEQKDKGKPWAAISVSALHGSGMQDLVRTIRESLAVSGSHEETGALITSLRHRLSLEQTLAALENAMSHHEQSELAALHLRESLAALASIVGETAAEDVLKSIFSKFCIGK